MNYCGLDIAGVSSYVFVTDAQGRKLAAGPVAITRVAFESRLRRFLADGLAVAIEAGNQTAWIYEVLVGLGARVTVVNPNKVKLIAESRRKTDKVDAKILCELLRLGPSPCICREEKRGPCAVCWRRGDSWSRLGPSYATSYEVCCGRKACDSPAMP
jgi:hypothetical protein